MILLRIKNYLKNLNLLQAILVLSFLGLLAYSNAIFHPFVHDDIVFIKENPNIGKLNFRDIFNNSFSSPDHFKLANKYYRPVLDIFNRFIYKIFGLNPVGYHFINILLHILNSVLVFILINKIYHERKLFSLSISTLFLLHPVQTEAVACISGISNLLFTFLCLLSFYLYIVSSDNNNKQSTIFYALSLLVFFISLFSKEQAVVLPIIIVLYEILIVNKKNIFRLRIKLNRGHVKILLYFILILLFLFIRKSVVGHMLFEIVDSQGEWRLRLLSIPRSLLIYLGLFFLPVNLHYYRCIDILKPVLLPATLLLAITIFVFIIFKILPKIKRPVALFGILWFLFSLLPTLNIVPLVNEYSFLMLAEHFLYFPIIGLLLFVAVIFEYLIAKGNKPFNENFIFVILLIIVVGCLILTFSNNRKWKDEMTLFNRTLKYEKNFGRVRMLLAKAYFRDGQFDKAVVEYNKALRIMKGYERKVENNIIKIFYLRFIKEIYTDLAHTYESLSNLKKAQKYYLKALTLDSSDIIIYYNMGINSIKMGEFHKAVECFEKVVALDKNNLMLKNYLAICYKEIGEIDKAEKLLIEIVEKDKESKSAKRNLELLQLEKNKYKE